MPQPQQSNLQGLTIEQRSVISEQSHRLIVENARDVIWSMSPTGQITYQSSAIEKLRGLTPEEALLKPLHKIVTPPSLNEVLDYFGRLEIAAGTEQPSPNCLGYLEYYRKDGTTFWTEVVAFPLIDDKGNLVEIIGITRDIDERLLSESRLKDAYAIAGQANHTKSRFLPHITHKIRTPLLTLLSLIQAASDKPESNGQQDLPANTRPIGQLLIDIVNNLLELSRTQQQQLKLRCKAIDLTEVLNQVRDLTAPMITDRSVHFDLCIEPDVITHVNADPTQLIHALLNLTIDAAKVTTEGQITVKVCKELEPKLEKDERALLRFSVLDTSPRFDPCLSRNVLADPQVVDTTADIGLAITRRLAKLMDGTVGYDARPGCSATFWFTCDLRPQTSPIVQEITRTSQDALLKGKSVLLVEDYSPLRKAIRRTLTELGFLVNEAENGAQALQKLYDSRYDLILMDIGMPIMNGRECTQQIRKKFAKSTLPIIGLTAAGFEQDRDDLIAIGMNDFLLKPFLVEDLVRAMLQQLDLCKYP